MTAPDSRRYLATLGKLAGGVILLVVALNYFVDPHAYFGRNYLGYYTTAERQFKLEGLQQHPDDAVLLGNSKAALTDVEMIHSPVRFFNAGVGGSPIEEILAMLGHVKPSAPFVLVALDYLQFQDDKPIAPQPLAPLSLHDALTYLFSGQTFVYSLKTLSSAALGLPPVYRDDGTFVATGWYEHYDRDDPVAYELMLDQREAQLRRFHFSPERIAYLERLRDALKARGKPFFVYLDPLQADELGRLRRAGVGPALDAWRAKVREVFPDVVDVTDSAYSSPKNFFRQDLLHPYPNISADIINRDVLPNADPALFPRPNGTGSAAK